MYFQQVKNVATIEKGGRKSETAASSRYWWNCHDSWLKRVSFVNSFVLHILSICEWFECRCSVGRIKNSILLRARKNFVGSNLCEAFFFLLAELPTNIMSTERIAETYSGNNREKCHILQTTTRLSTVHRDFIGVYV